MVIAPTHLIVKAGAVVGYASIGTVTVNTWVHTHRVTARESFTLLQECERRLAAAGH